MALDPVADALRAATVRTLCQVGVLVDPDRTWRVVDESADDIDVELSLPCGVRNAPGDGRLWIAVVGVLGTGEITLPREHPSSAGEVSGLRRHLAHARRVDFARARWGRVIEEVSPVVEAPLARSWGEAVDALGLEAAWHDGNTLAVGRGDDTRWCTWVVAVGVGTFVCLPSSGR